MALSTTPRTLQDQDRGGADSHQHDRVDDPLHDNRAEGGAAADSLAIAEVVASDQFAEPGRQDVVGEVSDEHVGDQASQRDRVDRGDEHASSAAPGRQRSAVTPTSASTSHAGCARPRTSAVWPRSTPRKTRKTQTIEIRTPMPLRARLVVARLTGRSSSARTSLRERRTPQAMQHEAEDHP